MKNKMNTKSIVSVITIFLDAEKFIKETIESVLAQTYNDWELLLIDDGSTDGSSAIAREYAEQYPDKIRYFDHDNHHNKGKSISRNLGITEARGKYITFLDADDVFLPEKLKHQVEILEAKPDAAMVYGPSLYWFSWTENPRDIQRDFMGKLGVQPDTLFNPPTLLVHFLKDGGTVPCICGLLARRQIVIDVGGFDMNIQHMYEDQVLLAKICLEAPVYVESGCWDRYRQHPDSSSSVAIRTGEYHPSKPNQARLMFLNWLEEYLVKLSVKHTEPLKVLHKELRPYRHPYFHLFNNIERFMKWLKRTLKSKGQRTLTVFGHKNSGLKRANNKHTYPKKKIDFGSLRRMIPISRQFGFDRGTPIDRYYIEHFLDSNKNNIRGYLLEIGDDSYSREFGGDRVIKRDVFHVPEGATGATIVGDLTYADHISSETYDCFILTQTLHLIYDIRAALQTVYRILKPGGIVLATFPGISPISNDQWGKYWCWSFTTLSAQRIFEEFFLKENISVKAFGNVFTAVAFLHGLASEELQSHELDYRDSDYEVLITVKAVKEKLKQ